MTSLVLAWATLYALPVATADQALESDRLEVRVDGRTGALASLADRRDGLQLLQTSPDRYALQSAPDREVVASEMDDTLVPGESHVYENAKLPGVRIEKRYDISARSLTKRVRFTARQRDVGFLKYSVTSAASPDFYVGGYLNDPSRHPIDYPYILTRDLAEECQIWDCHQAADHHLVIFTNPRQGRGLAQYRFAVDGRFVHPLTGYSYEPGLFYGPAGWRMAVAGKWMSDDREALECETRWHLFDGDHVAFHQEYIALPEFAAEWDWESPAWVRDVQAVGSWGWTSSSPRLQHYREVADALDGGYLMVMLGGIFHNTRAYMADPIPAAAGVPLPAEELRRVVDELHSLSPRIKVGPVTWQWGFGELDRVFHEYPEWTVHDGLGDPVFACSGWQHERVYSQLLTPACQDFVLSQFRGTCQRYDFDFIYMDTGQGGVTRLDWNTKRSAQDCDWADLYRGIRDAARSNRNGATFFNGSPRLYSSYSDCGYFEGVGFIKVRDWRALADRLFLCKLYQPGDKWTMPLYWRPDVLESYPAYCLALALKPGGFLGGTAMRRWPIVAAANELSEARLVPAADARPCWWREQTEIEAYSLRIPGGGLLSAINHDAQELAAKLSCDLAPLGLDPKQPVHVWLFQPKTVAELEQTVQLTEADANRVYADTGDAPYRCIGSEFLGTERFADGRAHVEFPLGPDRVALVLLTQEPRLATAVGGRPRHFLLPAPKGVRVETVPADQPLDPAVVARREGLEYTPEAISALLVPDQSTPEKMNREIKEIGREIAGLRVIRLMAFDCEHNGEDMATAEVVGDPPRVRLTADMGLEKVSGYAHAAVEAENAGALKLRVELREPLYGKYRVQPGCFVGLVADYHTGQAYTHRVRFALGPVGDAALRSSRPWCGVFDTDPTGGQPQWVDMSPEITPGETPEYTLDLGRTAPEGWTGRVIFGPYLESCGFGTRLTVDVLGNGPPGPRDETAFSAPPPPPARGQVAATFQSANIYRFEDGAELRDNRIVFPLNGCIEADGIRITGWRIRREADSRSVELWVNFQKPDKSYELDRVDLSDRVAPGAEGDIELDLSEIAPDDWNGHVRIRLRGDAVSAELISNQSFQVF